MQLTLFTVFTEDLKKEMECIPKLRDDKIRGALTMWEGMTTYHRDLNELNLEKLLNLIKFHKEKCEVLH